MQHPLYRRLCRNTTCETHVKKATKHGKRTKRSSSKTRQGLTRPNNTSIFKLRTNARLPNNNKNTKIIRHILRPKHDLSIHGTARKERIHQERMEHTSRETEKSLHAYTRRSSNAKLHRRLTKSTLPKNRNKRPQYQPRSTNNRSY